MKTHYIIHFEPLDIWANNTKEAEYRYTKNSHKPSISKILIAKHSFDRDMEKII
jgi:hypothetical protein